MKNFFDTPSYENILEFLSLYEEPLSKREITKAFHLKGSEARIMLKQTLREMVKKGMIIKTKHGFVIPDTKNDQKKPGNTNEESSVEELYGVLEQFGSKLEFIPVNRKEKRKIITHINPSITAKAGDLVLGEIAHDRHQRGRPSKTVHIQIVKVMGKSPVDTGFSQLALLEHDIPQEFSKQLLSDAKKLDPITVESKEKFRKDLTDIPFITIDGADARDFDDAVWAEKSKTGWHIIVGIADVAAYVLPYSEIDKEASLRGNSVYFPDRVVPMLPERLSNDLCSLNPDEDKASFVVHLHIDTKGNLKEYHFERAVIRSVARTTYDQIQDFLDTGQCDHKKVNSKIVDPLFAAYQCLQKNRLERGTLELETKETYVNFDGAGKVSSISLRQRSDSHKLIEEFMILANIAAAKFIDKSGLTGLFRNHDEPNPEKIHDLLHMLKHLKIEQKRQFGSVTPDKFNGWLAEVRGTDKEQLVQDLVLRSQSQAKYETKNIGHYGLGLQFYTHFTSPIRRYSDLLVHRLIAFILDIGQKAPPGKAYLHETAAHLCMTERRAERAERDTKLRYLTQYLMDSGEQYFNGRISGIMKNGLFIMIDEYHAEGFLPKRLLPYDRYIFDEQKFLLRGTRNHLSFQMGDQVPVKIVELAPIKGHILLELDEAYAPKRRPKPKRQSSKKHSSKRNRRNR